MQNKYWYAFLMSLASGGMLSLAWYPNFTVLAFIAIIPLLELERHTSQHFKRSLLAFWIFSWLTTILWNVGVYWWLWNASGTTTLAAWIANGLLQTIPLLAYQWGKNRVSKPTFIQALFVCSWIAFEYLHLHWDFSWVWLNLGNIFSNTPRWVQWYEYTGALGGALWILIVNQLIYISLRNGKFSFIPLLWIILPILISYLMYYQYQPQGKPVEIVVVQPNIDTYTEKFNYNARTGEDNPNSMPYDKQIDKMLQTAQSVTTPTTDFVLFPETALHQSKDESQTDAYPDIMAFRRWLTQYPQTAIVVGADTYLKYTGRQTNTTRYSEGFGYYDVFNTAIFLENNMPAKHYKKSELVIGVETIPFPFLFQWLQVNLGGASGSLGRQADQLPFCHQKGICLAPIICYESVYGATVAEFVRNGATILGIITNDDWWDDTPGHRQHLAYSQLRAIETRRFIARAANTGVSAFITPTGDFMKTSSYKEQIAMKETILSNSKLTLYVLSGDYIGKISAFLAVMMLLSVLVRKKTTKRH